MDGVEKGDSPVAKTPADTATSAPFGRLQELGLWPLSTAHIAQAGIVLAAILAAARMTAISNGDPQLAGSILAATGYIGPLANLLFAMVPLGLLVLAFAFWEYRQVSRRAGVRNWITRWSLVIVIDIFIALAFVAPWMVSLGLLAYTVVMGTLDWALFGRHWGDPQPTAHAPARRTVEVVWTVVLLGTLILMSGREPWMQKEVVATDTAETTGYVLRVDDLWTTVLVDSPRYLKYVRSDAVVHRTACESDVTRTLVEVLSRTDFERPPGCEPDVPDDTSPPLPSGSSTVDPSPAPGN